MFRTPLRQFAFLSIQLNRLLAAHHLIEDALARYDAGVDTWYDEQMEALTSTDPDDAEYMEEMFAEQKADAVTAYPSILRSALFGAAYGILESFVVSVCKHMETHSDGPRLRDLRGDGIQRARLYLAKVARVAFPDTMEWQRLTRYGVLRNLLVHVQGDLSASEQRGAIEQLQREVGTFAASDEDGRILLSKEHNLRFLETIEVFAEQLAQATNSQ